MKWIFQIHRLFPVFVFLGSVAGYAQTPTLLLARGNTGISSNEGGRASNFEFYMEASGWPRAVTAGETVFLFGSWPTGNNPTITDDKSNTWRSVTSCADGNGMTHGFFYGLNAAANTSVITATHGSAIGDQVLDWAHFYNMSATVSGFVDGNSCKTGVTPVNNTAPNISGTAYNIGTTGDLILTCVYVEGPLGQIQVGPNAFTSITWPAGFTGLGEDIFYGHACAYGISTSGSFTPTFTVAQGTHSSFAIMSAAFKAGSGGRAPGNNASISLAEVHATAGVGQTDTINLPCPAGTSAIVVADDAASLTGVSDSNSNAWSHVTVPGSNYGPIYYVNNPTITNGNTFAVSMTFRNSGNADLLGMYCLNNTAGIDAAANAQNGSALISAGSGAVYSNGNSVQNGQVVIHAPSIGTSQIGDLVLSVGAIGAGPAESCVAGQCVFDYVGSTNWTNGDQESYANGDIMSHQYALSIGTVDFQYNLASGVSGVNGVALAFKTASSQEPPAPPTGLQTTVR